MFRLTDLLGAKFAFSAKISEILWALNIFVDIQITFLKTLSKQFEWCLYVKYSKVAKVKNATHSFTTY